MKSRQIKKIMPVIVGVCWMSLSGYSAVLYSDDFSSYAIGSTPPAVVVNNSQVIDGSATMGHGNAVQMTDSTITHGASFLQQLAGATNAATSYSAIRFSFDIYNDQASGSTSVFQAVVGKFDGTMAALASQYLSVHFSTTNNSLKLQGNPSVTTNYNLAVANHIDIFINDSNSSGVPYWGGTLATNSYAVYLNGTQLAVVGMTTNLSPGTSNGLGRIGFYSSSISKNQFTVDNVFVTTDLSVPEPSTVNLLTLSTLSLLFWRQFNR